MSVDAETVAWLKEGSLYSTATDAGVAAAWGDDARETTISSPLALSAGAAAEAARQQEFLEGPLAIDVVTVKGLRSDLIGRPVTVTCDRLGYDGGATVFVIGVEEEARVERTVLTVLRRLA